MENYSSRSTLHNAANTSQRLFLHRYKKLKPSLKTYTLLCEICAKMVANAKVSKMTEENKIRHSPFHDYLKAYKLQIIWIILFIILQLFLYGMGVLQYALE